HYRRQERPQLQLPLPVVPEAPRKKRWYQSPGRILRDIVIPLAVAFSVAMFFQATMAKPYQIPSGSMLPTIQLQDRILANRVIYYFHPVKRGDIVVFKPPASFGEDTPFVKRVIGIAGDTVEIRDGMVRVNDEEFVVPAARKPSYTTPAVTVPEGMLYVLGDNRNESNDSHKWGFLPADNVIGRADIVYWPPTEIRLLRD
ncbi:MAG: signal peptidase I, partial [Actinomycetota bacterium]